MEVRDHLREEDVELRVKSGYVRWPQLLSIVGLLDGNPVLLLTQRNLIIANRQQRKGEIVLQVSSAAPLVIPACSSVR